MTNTCSVAVERELVASTRRVLFAPSYSARVIETVSAAGVGVGAGVVAGVGVGVGPGVGAGVGVPGAVIVSVAEREVLFAVAVIWADVADFTWRVVTLNFTDIVPAETVRLEGTAAFELFVRS